MGYEVDHDCRSDSGNLKPGVLRLMDKILHDLKDPELWELWYIPYYGSCRILSINRSSCSTGASHHRIQTQKVDSWHDADRSFKSNREVKGLSFRAVGVDQTSGGRRLRALGSTCRSTSVQTAHMLSSTTTMHTAMHSMRGLPLRHGPKP